MDFTVNSNPQGHVEIELFGDVPVGSRRFHQLAIGENGVGYRLSKIDGVSKVRSCPLLLGRMLVLSLSFCSLVPCVLIGLHPELILLKNMRASLALHAFQGEKVAG